MYHLPGDLAVTFWRTGIAGNDVYLLDTGQHHYVLKIYFINYLPAQVQTSTVIMEYLSQKQIPVPRILRNTSGELVTSLQCPEGVRYAVIFEKILGQEPDIFVDRDAIKIGRFVGRMYRALDECELNVTYRAIDQNYLIQYALDDIHRYLPAERKRIEYLKSMGKQC